MSVQIAKDATQALRQLFLSNAQTVERTAFKPGILEQLRNFFKSPKGIITTTVGTGATVGGTTVARTIGISGKTAVTGSIVGASIPLTAGLLTQTPGGQQALSATEQITNFFTKNPLILLALIGLGIIVVVKK